MINQKLFGLLGNQDIKKKACQRIEEMIGKEHMLNTPEVFQHIEEYDNYYLSKINGKEYVVLDGLSSIGDNKENNCLICSDKQCVSISNDNLNVYLNKVRYNKNYTYKLFMRMPLDEKSKRFIQITLVKQNEEEKYDIVEQEDGSIAIRGINANESYNMVFESLTDINKRNLPRRVFVTNQDDVETTFNRNSEERLYTKRDGENQSHYIEDKKYSYEEVIKECRKLCNKNLLFGNDYLMLVQSLLVNGIRSGISYDDSLEILNKLQPKLAKYIREYRENKSIHIDGKQQVFNGLVDKKDSTQRQKESYELSID